MIKQFHFQQFVVTSVTCLYNDIPRGRVSSALSCSFVCSSFVAVFCILVADRPVRTVATKSVPVVDIPSRSGEALTSRTKKERKKTKGGRKEKTTTTNSRQQNHFVLCVYLLIEKALQKSQ